MIIKSIVNLLVSLSILLFSYTEVFSYDLEEEIKDLNQERDKIKSDCLDLKKDNFKDIKSLPLQLVSIYYNGVLDLIIESNKDILKHYNKTDLKFCIFPMDETKEIKGFNSEGEGLILVGIGTGFLFQQANIMNNDADIMTVLSHEIAHTILDHRSKLVPIIRNIYKEFLDKKINTDFSSYYQQHPDYIKESRLHEIEADNLGLKLYINSGMQITNFRVFFTKMAEINFPDNKPSGISDEKWKLFSDVSNPQTCGSKGVDILKQELSKGSSSIEALKSESFNNFLSSIQYLNDKDIYPSGCFRFWNLYREEFQINDIKKDYDNNLVSTLFLKLDLKSYPFLSYAKNMNPLKNENIISERDPRFMIIMSLFHPGALIKYSVQNSKIIDSNVGNIDNNNFLVLRYSDLVKIIVILNSIEKISYLNSANINGVISKEQMSKALKNRLYEEIKKAFIVSK